MEKLGEYESWGVPNIWVVAGAEQRLYVYREGSLALVPTLALAGYPLVLDPADLWPSE